MALRDLTRPAVEQAIREYDELGREAFLRRHGFGEARGYYLVQNGRRYDSKAIAGVAHGYVAPGWQVLGPADFAGGENTVARVLRGLGFTVEGPSNVREGALPFQVGQLYNRQRDIHQRYGGQQQGGICTPSEAPYIFLFTGESGTQHGYSDGWREDGLFSYTGEGQRGDMQFVRGNRAIRDHLQDGRDLLLFQTQRKGGLYRFLGCFACAAVEHGRGPDTDGRDRETIVFLLSPVAEVETSQEEPAIDVQGTLEELRALAEAAATSAANAVRVGLRTYRQRSAVVKAYVLARARGMCESCGKEAPFRRPDGTPYLEPHHTKRLADDGPDHPAWVGAICPTCHREIHHGENGQELNTRLQARLREIEPERA